MSARAAKRVQRIGGKPGKNPGTGTKFIKSLGRAERKSGAQQPTRGVYRGPPKHPLELFVAERHDVEHADPKCRLCRGAGTVATNFAVGKKAMRLACSCVPIIEARDE